MGHFAAELITIITEHVGAENVTQCLQAYDMSPKQIQRLATAAEDPAMVATMQLSKCNELVQNLDLNKLEQGRLEAGREADMYLRLILYHKWDIEKAMTYSNAIFANTLKEILANGGNPYARYVFTPTDPPSPQTIRPRKRRESTWPN
jgi:hypothetical protein